MPAKYALGGEIHSVFKQDRGGENIYSFFCTHSYNQSHFIKVETLAIFINQGRLWAEIEAHKWRNLELNLSITATKF